MEDLKDVVDVKLYKLIAYVEILRETIQSNKNVGAYKTETNNSSEDLNNYYHKLGNIRYELKKLLGHHLITNSYKVNGDEL